MRSKLFASVIFAFVCQLGAMAVTGLNATFDCYKNTNSTNTLKLHMRNNGPDTIPAGTALYYYYYTPKQRTPQTHIFHAATDLQKGKIFDVLVPAPADTAVSRCGCSLKPLPNRPEVGPMPTEIAP